MDTGKVDPKEERWIIDVMRYDISLAMIFIERGALDTPSQKAFWNQYYDEYDLVKLLLEKNHIIETRLLRHCVEEGESRRVIRLLRGKTSTFVCKNCGCVN